MRFISSHIKNDNLTLILHGQFGRLDTPLEKSIFTSLSKKGVNVTLLEFSYVKDKYLYGPDQESQVKDVKRILKLNSWKNLTLIAHSNAIFVVLVLWEEGIKIKNLFLLNPPKMKNRTTPQETAEMLRDIQHTGKTCVILGKNDEYGSKQYMESFLQKYNLPTKLVEIFGNHNFEGYEQQVAGLVSGVVF